MRGDLTDRTDAQRAAERDWLDLWTEGPPQSASTVLSPGMPGRDESAAVSGDRNGCRVVVADDAATPGS